jgi:DnaJ-class molecular chaperone
MMGPVINRSLLSLLRLYPALAASRSPYHHRAPDYYAILGVAKHAEIKDIKFAYFNMAKKFHPDTNRTLDAKQMFSLVAEAYDVLSDDDRRTKYDETGLSEERFGGTSQGPGRQDTDSTYTAEEMYQTIFGQNAKDSEQQENVHEDFGETHAGRESTREYIVQVTAEEAVVGVRVGVQLRLVGVCDKCRGNRSELGYTGALCPYCEGTGQETVRTGLVAASERGRA